MFCIFSGIRFEYLLLPVCTTVKREIIDATTPNRSGKDIHRNKSVNKFFFSLKKNENEKLLHWIHWISFFKDPLKPYVYRAAIGSLFVTLSHIF